MTRRVPDLSTSLRLIVITDRTSAGERGVREAVRSALAGGARTVQLRDKLASGRELYQQARHLLTLTRAAGALLIVNDRADVAMAAGADGVHLGPHDLTVAAARRLAPDDFILGFSTDDPREARLAHAAGVDYLGCGAVFPTTSKDVGGEAIGLERLDEVARAVPIPVVGIGGIHGQNVRQVATTAATGAAVISAVMASEDPALTARELIGAFLTRTAPH